MISSSIVLNNYVFYSIIRCWSILIHFNDIIEQIFVHDKIQNLTEKTQYSFVLHGVV